MQIYDGRSKNWKLALPLIIVLGLMFIWYGNYIELAKCTIPYSDYFQWTAKYGEKLINDTINIKDYFASDDGEHIQPLSMYLTLEVLEKTNFDYSALVVLGMIARCGVAGFLALYYFFYLKKSIPSYICSAIVAYSLLNFNQWEIATEPFSFGNAIRLSIYFVSFIVSDWWVRGIKNRGLKENVLYALFLGIGISCITVFVGGGYFAGHVLAIGILFCYEFVKNIKSLSQYLLPMILWGVTTLAGCLIYIALIYTGERRAAVSASIDILGLVLGVVLYWGAAFFPNVCISDTSDLLLCAVVGTSAIILMSVLVVNYLRRKTSSTAFPVYCIIYSNTIAVVIAAARISMFSYGTMTSSRYVIESTIGIVGMVWILGEIIATSSTGWKNKACYIMAIGVVVVLLTISAKYELIRAPYVRQYYDDLENQLLDYQECSDETLTLISATSPEKARICLDFLKKEHLSIFRER